MPIKLDAPLAWTQADADEQKLLQSLQGNILKGHGRDETVNIFFRIDPAKATEMRRALRELANFHLTSAAFQLQETKQYHESNQPGGPFTALFLAASGYVALGASASAPAGEPQFLSGMRADASLAAVGDQLSDWNDYFKQQIDAMVLVGEETRNKVQIKRDDVVKLLTGAGATIVYEQIGSAVKNRKGIGIEHFGYVDGRSQPLLLKEDIAKESATAGTDRWDPAFPLSTALVKDPGTSDGFSFGSYFIFRKLEQNVQGFKRKEQELATKLGFSGDEQRELAGAMVVGRFEDGTPVTLSDEAKDLFPPNDFNFDGDPGKRCPFQAHIRKVNPRGDNVPGDRSHIMPRRGIPFTDKPRKVHPSDLPGSSSLKDFDDNVKDLLPKGDVGLLFMAYNSSLKQQFVFTQQTWANNVNFKNGGTGIDPIIGQGKKADVDFAHTWPKTWDDAASATEKFNFAGFVTMRGGEYFFAPSLTFLKNL